MLGGHLTLVRQVHCRGPEQILKVVPILLRQGRNPLHKLRNLARMQIDAGGTQQRTERLSVNQR